MEIIETLTFTRKIVELLDGDAYLKFQVAIAARPESGALIQGAEVSERFGSPPGLAESGVARG